jgi:hypothetical protein
LAAGLLAFFCCASIHFECMMGRFRVARRSALPM